VITGTGAWWKYSCIEVEAKGSNMQNKTLLLILAGLMVGTVVAQEAKVTPLLSKGLKEGAGKEGLMLVVEYPPGSSDPIHRHDASGFIYVLEGSVVMQVKGGNEVTLTPGQTFYEGPTDVHTVGRNASSTKPAKLSGVSGEGQRRSSAHAGEVSGKEVTLFRVSPLCWNYRTPPIDSPKGST
jgi:quercetin dioxygenase-like cupin family protein